MKRAGTIVGLLLVILIAGSSCHNARRDRREMKESSWMNRMKMSQNTRQRHGMMFMHANMAYGRGDGMMRGSGPGMGRGMIMMRGMGPGMGMRRGMGMMPMDSTGWMPMGEGRRILESIPNVTDNQKKQIEDLTKKDREEIKKLREEMSAKMKNLMDSHRKEVLNILTEEQKKFINSGKEMTLPIPEKSK
jgi:hypothetical protein